MLNTGRFRAFVIAVGSLFAQPSQAAASVKMMKDVGFGSPGAWKPAPCSLPIKFKGNCSFRAVESFRLDAIQHWGKDSFVPLALFCPNENSGKLVLMSFNNEQVYETMVVTYRKGRAIDASLGTDPDNYSNFYFMATLNGSALNKDDRLRADRIVERADFLISSICKASKI